MMVDRDYILGPDAEIPDRAAFAQFLRALASSVRDNPDSWERTDLASYLEVIAQYAVRDVDSFHRNWRGSAAPDPPTWRLVADLFSAGRVVYEDWDD